MRTARAAWSSRSQSSCLTEVMVVTSKSEPNQQTWRKQGERNTLELVYNHLC